MCTLILEGQCGGPTLVMSTGSASGAKPVGQKRFERSVSDEIQRNQVGECGRTFSPDPSESLVNNHLPGKVDPDPKS